MSKMKNYIGFSRDHSGSMGSIQRSAADDFNTNIQSIRQEANAHGIETCITVMKCGYSKPGSIDTKNVLESLNVPINDVQHLDRNNYQTHGRNTPLFDSIGQLIETFESLADADDDNVSFLIMAITDGQDNSSRKWSARSLGQKITQLQNTDRWTFVFRVPRGDARGLVAMGIPAGNIQEWDQTESGVAKSTQITTQSMSSYYTARSAGAKSTTKFFTDLGGVQSSTIKANLVDISSKVQFWTVKTPTEGETLREFCEAHLKNAAMLKGSAFYQLTKTEPKVQDYKQIAIRDKKTGKVYSGQEARNILGLPHNGDVRLAPGNHSHYDIFIQSTSVNRKLPVGTQVMYWSEIGVPYKEGKSAR